MGYQSKDGSKDRKEKDGKEKDKDRKEGKDGKDRKDGKESKDGKETKETKETKERDRSQTKGFREAAVGGVGTPGNETHFILKAYRPEVPPRWER